MYSGNKLLLACVSKTHIPMNVGAIMIALADDESSEAERLMAEAILAINCLREEPELQIDELKFTEIVVGESSVSARSSYAGIDTGLEFVDLDMLKAEILKKQRT